VINLRKIFPRLLAVSVFSISMLSLSTSMSSAAANAPTAPSEVKQDWAKERQERLKHFTDRLADRLEIKASQQNAFQGFVKTLGAANEHPAKIPDIKTDAASIARWHADMAAAHAQKLAQIADATAKLQEVLSLEQRKTLDQIAAHFGGRRGHRFHGGEREERGDQEHGHWGRHGQGEGGGHDREHQQQ